MDSTSVGGNEHVMLTGHFESSSETVKKFQKGFAMYAAGDQRTGNPLLGTIQATGNVEVQVQTVHIPDRPTLRARSIPIVGRTKDSSLKVGDPAKLAKLIKEGEDLEIMVELNLANPQTTASERESRTRSIMNCLCMSVSTSVHSSISAP